MKIQYKLSLSMICLSLAVLLAIAGGVDFLNHKSVITHNLQSNKQLAEKGAHHVDVHLECSAEIARTLASAPVLRKALQESNDAFARLSDQERAEHIDRLNKEWMASTTISSPFIQPYLLNTTSLFLKKQQKLMPGRYGEIFLTNRFGALVASTGKLTTLAHAHKYWWQASYADGKGRIFIDDRGFDTSVQGYVLGIVVPVYNGNGKEVVGILKSNINIMGPLKHIVDQFSDQGHGIMKIVRTNGHIVISPDAEPLSETIPKQIVALLQKKQPLSKMIGSQLVATTPVPLSLGSDTIGFGGSFKSIDHIKGNTGEAWHVVILLDESIALSYAHRTTKTIATAGLILALFVTLASLYWGRLLNRPLARLAKAAREIGEGNLDTKVTEKGGDEIGDLAFSLNEMAVSLKRTMASRQELLAEMDLRIKTEKELERLATTDDLTKLNNRRSFSQHLKSEVQRANRYDNPLAVMMFDIDHFKKVNDTYGHDTGDYVLAEVARLAQNSLRDQDLLARWGGEEFMVLLPQTKEEGALKIAHRLRRAIDDHNFVQPKNVTVSVGVTERKHGDSCDQLISRVDLALYEAKTAGRNKVEVTR